MNADLQQKLEKRLYLETLPVALVQQGKHGRPLWICHTFDEVLRGLLEMIKRNAEAGYYWDADPILVKALAGDPMSIVRWANANRDGEYEWWDLMESEPLPALPVQEKDDA